LGSATSASKKHLIGFRRDRRVGGLSDSETLRGKQGNIRCYAPKDNIHLVSNPVGNNMGYITKVLRPDEKLLATGKLHWIVYRLAIISMLVAVILWFVIGEAAPILRMTAFVLFAGFAVLTAIKEWLEQWITEIAITDRRVIYKTGLIRRQTAEMNMDKIESVKVDQSLLGRLLNYGSIHIRGTGEGLEHLDYISSPISLRNTITTK
jgi:hypothetical protein